MSPFTKEVLTSLDFLRQAIADVAAVDVDLGRTLTAITDDLVVNLESQMVLVFANVGVRRKSEEEAMLRARSDVTLLEQYRQACSGTVQTSVDAKTNKIAVANQHDPTPIVNALPADVPPFAADPSVQRTLLTSVHLTLEALGHLVGAERTTLYLGQKGTGTLRVVAAAPDVSLARRGAFLASHQGIVGSVYSTGIALRADAPTAETRRSFLDPVDAALGVRTDNCMVFPVLDKSTGTPVAVIECANKCIGWGEDDEVLMSQAARLLWYTLCYHEIDFHNGMVFNPSHLHAVRPYRPSVIQDLKDYHGAASVGHRQLIVRLRSERKDTVVEAAARALGLHTPEGDVPAAVKGRGQAPPPEAVEVDTMSRVRELNSYMGKVEDAHRHIMAELVATQRREAELREDTARKAHKIRLLEDNAQSLHDQLLEAKQALNKASFAPLSDTNAGDFESSMITLGSFLKRGASERLPPIQTPYTASQQQQQQQQQQQGALVTSLPAAGSAGDRRGRSPSSVIGHHPPPQSPLQWAPSATDPNAVLQHAAATLRELQRLTQTGGADHQRAFALTPQPGSTSEVTLGRAAPRSSLKGRSAPPRDDAMTSVDATSRQYAASKSLSRSFGRGGGGGGPLRM